MHGTDSNKYDDIITLPHYVSPSRARMSQADRAAQFSPFAALTGFEAAIRETARLTGQRAVLTETAKAALDEKLRLLAENLSASPEAAITYFRPDERKAGGEYVTAAGTVRKIDTVSHLLTMADGTKIFFEDIKKIEYELS